MDELSAYLSVLRKVPLFDGLNGGEIVELAACLNARLQHFSKGDILVMAGYPVEKFGILLSGGIEAVREDASGRRLILSRLGPSEMFGEVLACSVRRKSPVTVTAVMRTSVLFIDYDRLSGSCEKACPCHVQALRNMLKLLADKYFTLSTRLGLLTAKGVRERLSIFLSETAAAEGSASFVLPMNRSTLASYLNLDRSAMTRELSRMKKEGLISIDRNRYTLLTPERLVLL